MLKKLRLKQTLTMLLSSLFTLVLLACSKVVPNAEVCADKGIYGAICAWTRNGPITKIPVGDWNNRRIGYFCMDARDFGKYQMFIEKACAQDKNCIDEITTFVNNLKGK